ncbi:CGNR zinc finger domain-containing protein [Natronoglycomyces albus]|uniref:CGNR zinc finger domain-containing protein n=1 Tax=Natronoglycomyces albus TaxID=2811108 RepID=A0A895XTH5_9ACTN|nr:CGNR zinc finger domain-containing protein [Natronoglycomyces albus]QSB04938.1 CGNR zinc finger domain-containing protein [Natronoglycomyces albus]
MVNRSNGQAAPGDLEAVRLLLNTWLIPNDTREPEDHLDAYVERSSVPRSQLSQLKALRDDLRMAVERAGPTAEVVNPWVERLAIQPRVAEEELNFGHEAGLAGDLVCAVLEAVASRHWHRLKACPDCRWIFYDHSRNASKRWCKMTAGGPDGRSCGSIAKVRAHRKRVRSTE